MFANPSRRLPGPPWPEVSGVAVWEGARTQGFPSNQEGLPPTSPAVQLGQKLSFHQDGGYSPMTAAHCLHLRRVGPSLDRPTDAVGTEPAGGEPALCNSRPQFLCGRRTKMCGLQFLLVTKTNAVFTYLPRRTFFCISLCGLGSLEI